MNNKTTAGNSQKENEMDTNDTNEKKEYGTKQPCGKRREVEEAKLMGTMGECLRQAVKCACDNCQSLHGPCHKVYICNVREWRAALERLDALYPVRSKHISD